VSVSPLRVRAPAKLNLFLHVTGQRANGYHTLQTAFTMIDFCDVLDLGVREDGQILHRNPLPGVGPESDLTIRAARLLQRESGIALGATVGIEKRIPMGGGLGGGSSDAAAVLVALNHLWKLDWPRDRLAALSARLGADVPFFVFGQSACAEGVGEVLTPLKVPAWWYVVLTPDAHVPTPFVFGHPDLTRNTPPLKIADFSASGLGVMRNDLQPVVLKAFPKVAHALDALDRAAAQLSIFGARMTGSGACVFAAFETEQAARETLEKLKPEVQGFVAQGMARHPFDRQGQKEQ
jgi:4-diphosphocytidyl-2-C-methyl-D-erythritol kinase